MLHSRLKTTGSSMKSTVGPVVRCLVGNRHLYTTTSGYAARRMSERSQQVWDSSRGVVFAGEGRGGRVDLTRGFATSQMRLAEAGETEARTTVERETFETRVEEGQMVVEEKVEVVVEKVETVGVEAEEGQEKVEDGEQKAENGEQETKEDDTVLTPPYTPLDFKIPDDIFLAAKKAPKGSPGSYWTYRMYRGPKKESVRVHYCTSQTLTDRVIQRYFLNEPVIGFDLEWEADALPHHSARRNVSLIQIASPTRIALFHVALYSNKKAYASPLLKQILEDPNITKVGVWVMGDANKVKKYLNITPRGIFELSHLYKLVKYCESGEHRLINKKLVSLGKQAEEVLKLPLYKELDVRTSDWSKSLSLNQIIYAASDAYAGVQIYAMLNHQRLQLDPCPPLPHHAELKREIELPDHTVLPPSTEADEIEMTPAEAAATTTTTTTTTPPKKPKEPSSSTNPPKKQPRAASSSTPKKEKHPLVVEADLWVSQYYVSHPPPEGSNKTNTVMPADLRAYYLWNQNPDQSVKDICAWLRDPPVQEDTVLSYIFRAIKLGGVPYDKERMIRMLEAKQRTATPGRNFRGEIFLRDLKREEAKKLAVEARKEEGGEEEGGEEEGGKEDVDVGIM
ncbi:putative Werner syndrome ATP-dependent helicase [Cercophora samala]|uniref:Werner syndrome ATP-dependent helicase n=1 Tax=Cercophora samala TaxID=330535 RepID=A0AA39Z7H5_9PEZI|nr:putative Werner syndrome ATP-dependent helicase [Cercophora samala]